ncbi:MAG: S8 family peptidase [Elusimicrobia bacterium]|nr:S8 family peptidase [Elusimicrobiota bacterium]
MFSFWFCFFAAFAQASHVPDEVLIKWENSPTLSTWTIPGSGITIIRVKRLGNSGWELWKLPSDKHVDTALPYVAVQVEAAKRRVMSGQKSDKALGSLSSEPGIASYAVNNINYPFGRLPNDPLVLNQWHLDIIQAYGGWKFDVGASTPVTIGIMDTGINIDHIDLSSSTGKIWTNPVDLPGGGDQDGNGKLDDIWGWNFVSENNDVSADCGYHGSLVASIASAITDNGIGIAGISWGAKILPLKVFSTASACSGSDADIIQAIDYAIWVSTAHSSYTGRMVINMSLGCPPSDACGLPCTESLAVQDVISRALNNKVTVIAAKGNCGNSVKVVPADYPGVLAVGATSRSDSLAPFSSIGSGTDMVAPGVDIFGVNSNGGFGNNGDDGTSFSAPIVAGAAALIMSALPSATTTQIESFLLGGVDDLGSPGRDDLFGHGRLNLFKTMRLARFGTLADFDGTHEAIAVPNPFKPSPFSRVIFTTPQNLGGPNPRVQIYDISGMLIREIEGTTWDGRNENGTFVVSGVYIFRLKTDSGKASGRIIVDAGN